MKTINQPLIETLFFLVPFAGICFAVYTGSFMIGAVSVAAIASMFIITKSKPQ